MPLFMGFVMDRFWSRLCTCGPSRSVKPSKLSNAAPTRSIWYAEECREVSESSGLRTGTNQYEVLLDVGDERVKQDSKWGEQNHPLGFHPVYQPAAARAKRECDMAAKEGRVTWRDILEEEFWEAVSATTDEEAEAELIQVAAVAVAAVQCIRRRRNGNT